MKFTELKGDIKEGARGVYLLEGDDAYFRSRGEEMIKSAFLSMPELNYSSFDGEELKGQSITSLTSALKNYPFMSEKRIVKVSEFFPSESDYETYLKPLFSDFPSTAILIIVNSRGKKGAELKRKSGVTYVDCSKAEAETVAKWIYITFKNAGVICSAALAENIAAYCLCDMARVSVEVRKLIDYKGRGELTAEEVDSLVYKDADYRIYEMTNAVSRKNYTAYCMIRSDLQSKGFDEISIINGLLSYFRNILCAAHSRLSDAEYAAANSSKEYAVKKSREQARSIGVRTLENYEKYLYSAVSDIKSGKITPSGALLECENMIFFAGKLN